MFLRLRGGRLCNVDLNLLCDGFLQKLGYVPAVSTQASLRQAEKRRKPSEFPITWQCGTCLLGCLAGQTCEGPRLQRQQAMSQAMNLSSGSPEINGPHRQDPVLQ